MNNLDEFDMFRPGPIDIINDREYMFVNGIPFLYKATDQDLSKEAAYLVANVKDLEDVYDHPSPAKISKYNLWCNWAREIRNLYCFGILENSNKDYTLAGYIDMDDRLAVIKIKPGKNVPDACIITMEKVLKPFR